MEGYLKYNYNYLDNLSKDKGKLIQNRITDNPIKVEEKKPLIYSNNDKTIKEPKNNIIENKEKGNKNDTPNPDKLDNKSKFE